MIFARMRKFIIGILAFTGFVFITSAQLAFLIGGIHSSALGRAWIALLVAVLTVMIIHILIISCGRERSHPDAE